jgi:hypothetical protein
MPFIMVVVVGEGETHSVEVRGRWQNEGSQVGSGVGSELGVWWSRKVQTSPALGGRWGSERVVVCLVGGRRGLSVKGSYDAQLRRQM